MAPIRKLIQRGTTPQEFPDTIGNKQARRFDFSAENRVQLKVKVPQGKSVRAKNWAEQDPPSQADFTLTRLVMNLEVPGGADEIELEVWSDDESETKLAYYYNNRWNVISESKQGGYFTARVQNWPADPEIGIGH